MEFSIMSVSVSMYGNEILEHECMGMRIPSMSVQE